MLNYNALLKSAKHAFYDPFFNATVRALHTAANFNHGNYCHLHHKIQSINVPFSLYYYPFNSVYFIGKIKLYKRSCNHKAFIQNNFLNKHINIMYQLLPKIFISKRL